MPLPLFERECTRTSRHDAADIDAILLRAIGHAAAADAAAIRFSPLLPLPLPPAIATTPFALLDTLIRR